MNEFQLMGLNSVGIDIYVIHGYFRELMVGQRTLGFWDITGTTLTNCKYYCGPRFFCYYAFLIEMWASFFFFLKNYFKK